jgi:hypothetical protein
MAVILKICLMLYAFGCINGFSLITLLHSIEEIVLSPLLLSTEMLVVSFTLHLCSKSDLFILQKYQVMVQLDRHVLLMMNSVK